MVNFLYSEPPLLEYTHTGDDDDDDDDRGRHRGRSDGRTLERERETLLDSPHVFTTYLFLYYAAR